MSVSTLPRITPKSQLQPILLQGHERSITQVKFNQDGDLLFTTAKDNKPTVWYADTGERIGTYDHHKGAVWDIDPSWDSEYVVTACADGSARLFETTTGRYIAKMPHKGAARAVSWGEGSHHFAKASDPFTSRENGNISIYKFPADESSLLKVKGEDAPILTPELEIPVDGLNKAICLGWTAANQHILAGFDSGMIAKYDVNTGQEVQRKQLHSARVNRLNFNSDKTLFITASVDTTALVVDPETLDIVKTFKTDRPVNGAVISPLHPHVLLGGGQDAMHVTVTAASAGKFETRFFHLVYGEEFGRVKGHFGPINAIAMHPSGKSYASGAEDGFIRLHHFDQSYIYTSDLIPEDLK